MAYTVGYALFGALLTTLTLIPGLAYIAFRKPRRMFRNLPLEWLQARYQASLSFFLWILARFGVLRERVFAFRDDRLVDDRTVRPDGVRSYCADIASGWDRSLIQSQTCYRKFWLRC
jgi:hypothetical protein